jgi:hypothetical protein
MAEMKVRAKYRGQKPDRTWAEEGEVFEIDAKLFSKRWMEKVVAKVAKAEPVEKTDE